MKIDRVYYFQLWHYSLFQDFSFGETNFYFHQILSNFLKYSFSNFLLFYLYNIFAVYFSGNSSLLKSHSFTKSNFSCLLTSVLSLFSNSATTSFVFYKSSFLFYVSFSAINPFYYTKYFVTPCIFFYLIFFSLLNSIHFHWFCFLYFLALHLFLYLTTWLMFTTRWILIEVGSYSLTTLVNTTFLIIYRPTYQFHSLVSLLPLSTCHFISFCTFLNTVPAFSCIFFILFANSIAFSTFFPS